MTVSLEHLDIGLMNRTDNAPEAGRMIPAARVNIASSALPLPPFTVPTEQYETLRAEHVKLESEGKMKHAVSTFVYGNRATKGVLEISFSPLAFYLRDSSGSRARLEFSGDELNEIKLADRRAALIFATLSTVDSKAPPVFVKQLLFERDDLFVRIVGFRVPVEELVSMAERLA